MVPFSAPFDAYARACFVNSNIPLQSTARSISSGSCTLNWQGQSRCESWCMHPSPSRRPLWLTAHGSTSEYCYLPWRRRIQPRLSLCLGEDFRDGSMHESGVVGDGVVNHDESSASAAVGSSTTDPQQRALVGEPEAVTLVRRKRGRPKGSTSKKKVVLLPTAAAPSNTQAAVCSSVAEEASAAKAAPVENPIGSGTCSSTSISSKEDEVALGASNDSASLTPPWCPPTESPVAVGKRQQALREAALLEDSPPPARKISIARAASAAKKDAASATPRSEKREWVEDPRALGQQQRASGGGAGAGAWPRTGAVANSVVYTGRALGGKRSSRSPSRRQPTRPAAGAADGDRSPPVGSFLLGEEGEGAVAGEGERERMPLLERAEVNAIIAASTPQGFVDAPVDGFTELDTVVNAKAALMAMLEDEGAEELGDICESQELDAEFVAVTAAVPGATNSTPRACDKTTAMGAPQQQEEEQEPWRHALSLKDRLSLTDDDVSRLQASRRTGLGAARGLEARLTSRSAGGPSTAIGYLLGELRMRPEEVREALLWWPPLLVMSERGAHAVAAWLQGGLGLSADDVCKMVKRNPAIVSCSIVHNLRPKLGWLQQELGLSRPKSIRLIVRCPAIFTLSIDDNMAPKVEWLETKLRLTKQQAARVVFANPGVLLSSVEGSLMPKIRWLAEALQMEEEMVFDMVRRYPMFFSLSSKINLEPKLAWLADHASSDIVRRVIFRQPSLLGHNAQGNLAPKVQWLQDRLGMSEEAAWKFVGKSPGFLTLSVSETLEPKLWWLRDKLEVGLEGAAKILMTFPNLFHLSIEASLEPKLWWVRDALGLDRPDAAAILRRCPQIFGASLKDTLEPKLPWLAARLRTDKQRIADIVKKYPQILMYSIERNLAPTIDFFEFEMGEVQPDELVDRLEMKPSALAASIEKRLLPRVSKMRMAGIEPRFSRDFRNIAVQTDAEFRAWMARTKAKSRRTADDRPPTDESRPPSPGVELASISIGERE